MPVAEIFLSSFVNKLASGQRWTRSKGIKKLEKLLIQIQSMTSNAEEQQMKNNDVRIWLDDLQVLAYDLDDILDEFSTEELKRKLDGLNPLQASTSSKVKAYLPNCYTTGVFSPSAIMFGSQMRSKIDGINSMLESIINRGRDLTLDSFGEANSNRSAELQILPTTSLILEPLVFGIFGRDNEKEKITEFLLADHDKIEVICISGIVGIGKTTLAQALYNDEDVTKHFDTKLWVYVSEDFDIMRITKSILESITSKYCDLNYLDQVQSELKKSLDRKKFLIILDDVRIKNKDDWNLFKSPFSEGVRGSKVIVTTHDEIVASVVGTGENYALQKLPNNHCSSIFSEHVFGNRSKENNPNLVAIGEKLVEKCEGIPLAVRTIGGLLRCKEREDEWEDVLNSIWWEDTNILPALRVSYHHLPSHLKPCFAYCSILPKHYEFKEKELVLLWMAEGFVQQGRGNEQLEDIGHIYFQELLSRSFIQPSDTKGSLKFLMHNLINDLAHLVSGDLTFRNEDKLEANKKLCRARHSSVCQEEFEGIKKFESFFEAKHLRTFLPFSLSDFPKGYSLAANVPSIWFPNMRCLRTLSLRMYRNIELPDSVGDMKHLRYLDISFTNIKKLPDWVQELYNLQTLILRECNLLYKMPKTIGNLEQLRHFDVTNTRRLREMPLGIGNMKNLQMLSDFIVTKNNGSRIKELGKLNHIGETLRLSGLQNVMDPTDATNVFLKTKEKIDGLRLEYGRTPGNIPNKEIERKVLEKLRPHYNLKELRICEYHGLIFPTWLGSPLFTNMVHIEIKNCKNCNVLPPFGQLDSLKELHIIGMSGVERVDREFYGHAITKPFPDLEVLRFEDMLVWENWFPFENDDKVQPFDYVSRLLIINCPKLAGKLPNNLPRLENLELKKCPKLVVEFDGLVYPSITSLSVDGIELQLCSLMLDKMRNTHPSTCLTSLRIENVSIPDPLRGTSIFCQHLNSVANLTISNIHNLVCIPKWVASNLTALKQLKISSCKELKTLPDNSHCKVMQLQQQFPVLQSLHIKECPQLVSNFFEGEDIDGESQGNYESKAVRSFMPMLESLDIERCSKLDKLPRKLHMLTSLVQLRVYDCNNLVSLLEAEFPSTLKTLRFKCCKALKSPLPCWNNDNNLETVDVSSCSSLTSLFSSSCSSSISTGGLPSSLKTLLICNCEKLESLVSQGKEMKIHCPSLELIDISGCGRLKYLPDTHYSNSLGNLRKLVLNDLQGLSDGWLRAITNLKKGGEKTVFSYILKEANSLTNLTSLELGDITTNVDPSEWGLHRLSSLTKLELAGPIRNQEGVVVKLATFPLDGMLPTSLTTLHVADFPDLERLSSKGFVCLISLQHLRIIRCPRLAYLPDGGFPDTLLELQIPLCPVLEKQCEKGKGKYWPILSRIPLVWK